MRSNGPSDQKALPDKILRVTSGGRKRKIVFSEAVTMAGRRYE
jgi:hypothetical protein